MEGIGLLVLPSILLFPLWSFISFSLLQKKLLRLFTRLGVGILMCLLFVLCLLITDIFGHIENINETQII